MQNAMNIVYDLENQLQLHFSEFHYQVLSL